VRRYLAHQKTMLCGGYSISNTQVAIQRPLNGQMGPRSSQINGVIEVATHTHKKCTNSIPCLQENWIELVLRS
jgi:hypothetical protein